MNTVYLEKQDVGSTLTTYLYCNMWMLHSAEKLGLSGYINWPRDPKLALTPYFDHAAFDRCPNMFEWYFQQPLFAGHPAPPPPRDQVWTWENCKELGVDPLMSRPLAYMKDYFKRNIRFNSEVDRRGAILAAKYALDFPNLIGVTWRGTDCVTDGRPYMPIETYFPFIDDILAKEPQMRIACTAEEESVLDPLLRRYPQAFKVEEFYASPKGSPHNPERFSPFSGFERGMQPALMVWLFSQCAHYIKNRSSTGAVASWLSSGRIVSLAHPENLGHGFDLTKAEINGELVPLTR